MRNGDSLRGVKPMVPEADHLSPSNTGVTTGWTWPSTLHIICWYISFLRAKWVILHFEIYQNL